MRYPRPQLKIETEHHSRASIQVGNKGSMAVSISSALMVASKDSLKIMAIRDRSEWSIQRHCAPDSQFDIREVTDTINGLCTRPSPNVHAGYNTLCTNTSCMQASQRRKS